MHLLMNQVNKSDLWLLCKNLSITAISLCMQQIRNLVNSKLRGFWFQSNKSTLFLLHIFNTAFSIFIINKFTCIREYFIIFALNLSEVWGRMFCNDAKNQINSICFCKLNTMKIEKCIFVNKLLSIGYSKRYNIAIKW